MCQRLPGNSVLSSTKEDHQNKLLVTCCYTQEIWGPRYSDYTHKTNRDFSIQIIYT